MTLFYLSNQPHLKSIEKPIRPNSVEHLRDDIRTVLEEEPQKDACGQVDIKCWILKVVHMLNTVYVLTNPITQNCSSGALLAHAESMDIKIPCSLTATSDRWLLGGLKSCVSIYRNLFINNILNKWTSRLYQVFSLDSVLQQRMDRNTCPAERLNDRFSGRSIWRCHKRSMAHIHLDVMIKNVLRTSCESISKSDN